MRVKPHIVRGPDFDACLDYCGHDKTMAQKAIVWQADDGEEYGVSVTTAIANIDNLYIDEALWERFEDWYEGQAET